MQLTRKYAWPDNPISGEVQKALAREFRGLWTNAGCSEELDSLAREIAATSFWRDGWIAARQTRTYDGKGLTPELRDRLTALEEFLRPKDLAAKARGLVIGPRAGSLDFDDLDEDEDVGSDEPARYAARAARSAAAIRELGHDIAADSETFKAVLPELLGWNTRASPFGEALAEAVENPRELWEAIVTQYEATERPSLQLLGGYLRGVQKRDAALSDILLDEALEHPTLAASFPVLQASVEIDERALGRLHRALDLAKADITSYYSLAYGQTTDNVSGPEFRDLVSAIARQPGGAPVGLEIVSMRLHADHNDKREPLPEVREAGRIALAAFEFRRKDDRTGREDYELGIVVRASLAGPEGAPVARRLCRSLMAAVAKHETSGYDYDDLMKSVLKVHPFEILDELFPDDVEACKKSVRLISNILRFHKTALDGLADDVLLTWCDRMPVMRYPLAASVAVLFKRPRQGEPHEWTPLAIQLLQNAPDPRLVLNEVIYRLHPTSWSGSLATKLEERLKLLNKLPSGDAPHLGDVLMTARTKLQAQIEAERRSEQNEDRAQNNRFE